MLWSIPLRAYQLDWVAVFNILKKTKEKDASKNAEIT